LTGIEKTLNIERLFDKDFNFLDDDRYKSFKLYFENGAEIKIEKSELISYRVKKEMQGNRIEIETEMIDFEFNTIQLEMIIGTKYNEITKNMYLISDVLETNFKSIRIETLDSYFNIMKEDIISHEELKHVGAILKIIIKFIKKSRILKRKKVFFNHIYLYVDRIVNYQLTLDC